MDESGDMAASNGKLFSSQLYQKEIFAHIPGKSEVQLTLGRVGYKGLRDTRGFSRFLISVCFCSC